MAIDKAIDSTQLDADLTSVADKIRAKTGGEEKLAFPSGFESALDTIESTSSALAKIEYDMTNGYTDYTRYFQARQYMTEIPYGLMRHISSSKTFQGFFHSCSNITIVLPLDTLVSENFSYMFYYCERLTTIMGIDISNATVTDFMFSGCNNLENITFDGVIKIGGLNLSSCPKLTHDSLMSAINALYDYASEGSTIIYTLKLGSKNLAKLTDAEKAIAISKGWTLQ